MSDNKIEEIERLRAENERLTRERDQSRSNLRFVIAERDATFNLVIAQRDEARAEVDWLRAAATSAGDALDAAIELLERGPGDAPSKRMFSQMKADYRVIVARTRKALEGKP